MKFSNDLNRFIIEVVQNAKLSYEKKKILKFKFVLTLSVVFQVANNYKEKKSSISNSLRFQFQLAKNCVVYSFRFHIQLLNR